MIHCVVCLSNGRPNKLGTLREDAFSVAFPSHVCEGCAELLFGFFSELLLQTRADSDMGQAEKIERFIYRMRNGGKLPSSAQTPKQAVKDLLKEMQIDPGEDL